MMTNRALALKLSVSLALLAGAFAGLLMLIRLMPQAAAAGTQSECNAAIVLDRSGSVSADNMQAMVSQVQFLFDPVTGFNSDKYKIAFWSFSSTTNPSVNYDAPMNTYVSSAGGSGSFNQNLSLLLGDPTNNPDLHAGTDYEQGLGYDGYALNRQKINTHTYGNGNDTVQSVIQKADVVVFMSDGLPNTPGSGGDGNPTAIAAAKVAAANLRSGANGAGKAKILVGGVVQYQGLNLQRQQTTMKTVLGNDVPLFSVDDNYANLSDQLHTAIGNACADVLTPASASKYSLTPTVVSHDKATSVSGSVGATFDYSVTNTTPTDSTADNIGWTVKRLVVDKDQSVAPLSSVQQDFSCDKLKDLVNRNATCDDNIASGTTRFIPGTTFMNGIVGPNATSLVVDDQWPVGANICYVLTVDRPTENASPANRYSAAACVPIGKRPFVQVRGGDLRVGRQFSGRTGSPMSVGTTGDSTIQDSSRIYTSSTTKADGRTYGSWAEYGVFSPGLVTGFASHSGLANGYPSSVSDQSLWSTLTFANKGTYGEFNDDSSHSTIPDTAGALLSSMGKVREFGNGDTTASFGAGNGIYLKAEGNIELDTTTLSEGQSYVLSVPKGTVTIVGNIQYDDGPYHSLAEIPQMVIIAKNIVIKDTVGRVDSWLVANGSGADGRVVTCDKAVARDSSTNVPGVVSYDGTNPRAALTVDICNQLLVINGPIMANHLQLRRTFGAGSGCTDGTIGSPRASQNTGNCPAGDPAEIINLPADAYLWTQSQGQSNSRAQTVRTTEMPPYF